MNIIRNFALPLCLYLALSLALFGKTLDFSHHALGVSTDVILSMWFLKWWPWAILHGVNPFHCGLVWAPIGFPVVWATGIPVLSFLASPITLLAGPAVAYNVLILSGPALAAWTMYLLVRMAFGKTWPALFAGYLFGFGSFEVVQVTSHLNLSFVCLLPVLVMIGLARYRGELRRLTVILSFALVMVLQFGISLELFAMAYIAIAVSMAAFFIFVAPPGRRVLLGMVRDGFLASLIIVAVTSPYLLEMARTASIAGLPPYLPDYYSSYLANVIIPTPTARFFGMHFAPITTSFSGNITEADGYIGLPLLVIVGLVFWQARRTEAIAQRGLLLAGAVLFILALGPHLHVLSKDKLFPLPWIIIEQLPLIKAGLPTRMTVFVDLLVALIAASWLAYGKGAWRYCVVILGMLAILPNKSIIFWQSLDVPTFFSDKAMLSSLGSNANVIMLPYYQYGPTLNWEMTAMDHGVPLRQAGGYVGFVPTPFHIRVVGELMAGLPDKDFAAQLIKFGHDYWVTTVIAGPNTKPAILKLLDEAGWPKKVEGGVVVYDIPRISSQPETH